MRPALKTPRDAEEETNMREAWLHGCFSYYTGELDKIYPDDMEAAHLTAKRLIRVLPKFIESKGVAPTLFKYRVYSNGNIEHNSCNNSKHHWVKCDYISKFDISHVSNLIADMEALKATNEI